jgi:hypothetical protein
MTSLAGLLGTVSTAIQMHPLCERVTEVETREFSPDQFIFKVKAELVGKVSFQARVYFNRGHVDYAYQVYTDAPLLRWDNKEEFRSIPSYPHHHHDADSRIHPSPLTGNPASDIHVVLDLVNGYLSARPAMMN